METAKGDKQPILIILKMPIGRGRRGTSHPMVSGTCSVTIQVGEGSRSSSASHHKVLDEPPSQGSYSPHSPDAFSFPSLGLLSSAYHPDHKSCTLSSWADHDADVERASKNMVKAPRDGFGKVGSVKFGKKAKKLSPSSSKENIAKFTASNATPSPKPVAPHSTPPQTLELNTMHSTPPPISKPDALNPTPSSYTAPFNPNTRHTPQKSHTPDMTTPTPKPGIPSATPPPKANPQPSIPPPRPDPPHLKSSSKVNISHSTPPTKTNTQSTPPPRPSPPHSTSSPKSDTSHSVPSPKPKTQRSKRKAKTSATHSTASPKLKAPHSVATPTLDAQHSSPSITPTIQSVAQPSLPTPLPRNPSLTPTPKPRTHIPHTQIDCEKKAVKQNVISQVLDAESYQSIPDISMKQKMSSQNVEPISKSSVNSTFKIHKVSLAETQIDRNRECRNGGEEVINNSSFDSKSILQSQKMELDIDGGKQVFHLVGNSGSSRNPLHLELVSKFTTSSSSDKKFNGLRKVKTKEPRSVKELYSDFYDGKLQSPMHDEVQCNIKSGKTASHAINITVSSKSLQSPSEPVKKETAQTFSNSKLYDFTASPVVSNCRDRSDKSSSGFHITHHQSLTVPKSGAGTEDSNKNTFTQSMSARGLASYTPSKIQIGSTFELGVSRTAPPVQTSPPAPPPQTERAEDEYLRPADESETVTWSAESTSDMLF